MEIERRIWKFLEHYFLAVHVASYTLFVGLFRHSKSAQRFSGFLWVFREESMVAFLE